jgi:hypothetical protein
MLLFFNDIDCYVFEAAICNWAFRPQRKFALYFHYFVQNMENIIPLEDIVALA